VTTLQVAFTFSALRLEFEIQNQLILKGNGKHFLLAVSRVGPTVYGDPNGYFRQQG